MSLSCRFSAPLGVALAGALASPSLGCREKERVDPTEAVFTDFTKRVDEYVALRQRLVDAAGPLDVTKSQTEIAARAKALADSIVVARPGAKQGDIFTTEAAAIIATLIRQEYSRRPDSVIEVREDAQEELPDFVPKVNQLYPTTYPLATFPPTLLTILPRLPDQLEYRIVTHVLILRDVEANLIVDFMTRAVP